MIDKDNPDDNFLDEFYRYLGETPPIRNNLKKFHDKAKDEISDYLDKALSPENPQERKNIPIDELDKMAEKAFSGNYDSDKKKKAMKKGRKVMKRAPTRERLTWLEKAEYLIPEQSSFELVEDMIVNTYSYLAKEDYQNASKQFEILKNVDLEEAFDYDKILIAKVNDAISDLEKRLE